MKYTIIIDKNREEEVVVYAKEKSTLIDEIERLVSDNNLELIGYDKNGEGVKLIADEVYCFTVEDNKIFAITEKDKLRIKCRLYQLEEALPEYFVKINQSCVANIRKVARFDTSVSGTLLIKFKNGYKDYVSRRQMKAVKERFGL